jgi:uncharacterized RDD family membrane protein YckC
MDENLKTPTRIGEYAGFVTRLAARVIDMLVISLIFTLIGFIAGLILNTLAPGNEVYRTVMAVIVIFVDVLVAFFYYVGSWMLAGQSLGKSVMGLRIVTTDGDRIKWRHGLVRYFTTWISAMFLFLGYFWVLVDNRRRAWHDILAHTMVVYSESWEERSLEENTLRDYRRRKREERMGKIYH